MYLAGACAEVRAGCMIWVNIPRRFKEVERRRAACGSFHLGRPNSGAAISSLRASAGVWHSRSPRGACQRRWRRRAYVLRQRRSCIRIAFARFCLEARHHAASCAGVATPTPESPQSRAREFSAGFSVPHAVFLPGGCRFSDTERFYLRTEGRPDHRNADDSPPDLAQLRAQLNLHLAGLPRNGESTPFVRGFFSMCAHRRNWSRGYFH